MQVRSESFGLESAAAGEILGCKNMMWKADYMRGVCYFDMYSRARLCRQQSWCDTQMWIGIIGSTTEVLPPTVSHSSLCDIDKPKSTP